MRMCVWHGISDTSTVMTPAFILLKTTVLVHTHTIYHERGMRGAANCFKTGGSVTDDYL